uniref:Uncharacterized protein n=1 Tax=Anguilla anguilla TaxID=7936 RepID=A0A0E9VNA8_ANGAN
MFKSGDILGKQEIVLIFPPSAL